MIVDDFKNDKGLWSAWPYVDGKQVRTWSGLKWNNMRIRCKAGGSMQKDFPTYIGCTMSDNFKDFQFFVEWARGQVGYGLDVQLDKDLLLPGNKVYGEDTCLFLPAKVNTFLVSCKSLRGEWPVGVSFKKKAGKFKAGYGGRPGGVPYLGYFPTPEEAFQAYKTFKEAQAKRLAAENRSQLDPRAYEALLAYTVNIGD